MDDGLPLVELLLRLGVALGVVMAERLAVPVVVGARGGEEGREARDRDFQLHHGFRFCTNGTRAFVTWGSYLYSNSVYFAPSDADGRCSAPSGGLPAAMRSVSDATNRMMPNTSACRAFCDVLSCRSRDALSMRVSRISSAVRFSRAPHLWQYCTVAGFAF